VTEIGSENWRTTTWSTKFWFTWKRTILKRKIVFAARMHAFTDGRKYLLIQRWLTKYKLLSMDAINAYVLATPTHGQGATPKGHERAQFHSAKWDQPEQISSRLPVWKQHTSSTHEVMTVPEQKLISVNTRWSPLNKAQISLLSVFKVIYIQPYVKYRLCDLAANA